MFSLPLPRGVIIDTDKAAVVTFEYGSQEGAAGKGDAAHDSSEGDVADVEPEGDEHGDEGVSAQVANASGGRREGKDGGAHAQPGNSRRRPRSQGERRAPRAVDRARQRRQRRWLS